MLAARLHSRDDLRVELVADPGAGAGELLLGVGCATICGTDLRMVRSGHDPKVLPLVLGHELAGTIAAVGAGVTGWTSGDRVAVAPNVGCGTCDLCAAGDTHLCRDYRALGIHWDGGMAEFVRVPAPFLAQGNVVRLADGDTFVHGALAEPLSCVINAFDLLVVGPGDSVVVFGAGAIGLMHAMLARLSGADPVIVADPQVARRAQAAALDDSIAVVAPGDVGEALRSAGAAHGAEVVITACAAPQAQAAALDLAAVNGRVCLFGGLSKEARPNPLDTNLIHYKQLRVVGAVRSSPSQFRRAVRLLGSSRVDFARLVTATFPLADAAAAFEHGFRGEGLRLGIVFS